MSLLLIVCTILGGIVAAFAIVAAVTERGRRAWRRFVAWLRRRPVPPRTNVHIEPDRQFCYWGKSPPPQGGTGQHVAFEMHGVATSLTKGHDLHLVDVELRGFPGEEIWHAINSVKPGIGMVTGAILPPTIPVEMSLIVTIERADPLPDGPIQARMRVKDQFGNRYRTPKVTFKDSALDRAKYGRPPGQPDLNNPLNRPPAGLPPARIRRQTGGPIEPT